MGRALAVLLLVAALTQPASAGPDVRVIRGATACGGQTMIVGPHRVSCVHAATDVALPPYRNKPYTAPVVCFGDGTTGPRVQMLYAYVAGRPNLGAQALRQLRQRTAPHMQGVISAASKGKDLAIRFAFAPGCAGLTMPVLRLASARGTPQEQLGRIIEQLQGLGYDRADRKYQVWVDGWTTDGTCGLGELMATMDQPHPANVHDGVPTVGGHTDVTSTTGVGSQDPAPRYSAVWHRTFGPRGPDCWEQGLSHAMVQVHELFHTLGAVQLSAPHSDGGGHCTDTPSVMCPVRRKATVASCARSRIEVLDCGMDDYWDPDAPNGSYLATGDNIATSVFFGPQPQDRLAALPF